MLTSLSLSLAPILLYPPYFCFSTAVLVIPFSCWRRPFRRNYTSAFPLFLPPRCSPVFALTHSPSEELLIISGGTYKSPSLPPTENGLLRRRCETLFRPPFLPCLRLLPSSARPKRDPATSNVAEVRIAVARLCAIIIALAHHSYSGAMEEDQLQQSDESMDRAGLVEE